MASDSEDENLESVRVAAKANDKLLQLPMSRVRTIMKSSPDLVSVSQHGYFLIAKATELFAQYLAQEAYNKKSGKADLDYKALSSIVSEDEALDFLEEIIPPKIRVSEYWKKIGKEPPNGVHKENASPKKTLSPSKKHASPSLSKSPSPAKKPKSEVIVID